MTNEPLNDFLQSLKTDIINSLQSHGKITTGQTAQQITINNTDDGAQLEMPGYMQLLETGRRPTSSNPAQGSPPMMERIKAWCQAKGIPDQAAWAVKKSIDKKGFKGTPGILSEPLSEDNINLRLDPAANQIADAILEQITSSLGL